MIRIAVPNKGSLAEGAADVLAEAGYRRRGDAKELMLFDPANDAELFFLRPNDIAVFVGNGTLDVGITGRDMLLESGAPAVEVLGLGFARSAFRFAGPIGCGLTVATLGGRRIATSFPGLVRAHLAGHGVEATTVRLEGAVEAAVRLGVADLVADVVESGTTLRNAGLEPFGDPILESEAVVVRPADRPIAPAVDILLRRLQGVVVARRYVLIDYDVPAALLEQACAITPGLESPTISPLHDGAWVAVRAMVPADRRNHVMDDLHALGARAILVTSIHACRI